jgi:D-alanine-D-alanine ligase
MSKIRVGILFGGKSAEHEVSVRSARNIYEALDKEKFEPVLIGIEPNGKWIAASSDKLLGAPHDSTDQRVEDGEGSEVMIAPESKGEISALSGEAGIDVVFPILHGPYGEDGTIQGLLRLADVPFVGAGVLGSAVGMDKDVMKRLLRDAGISVADYVLARRGETYDEAMVEALGLPLFIKPANLGSSIGISKVHKKEELQAALDEAFLYDNKVIIEKGISGREFECGILGNEHPEASVVGEIIPTHEFYDYDAKYIDENGATTRVPADFPEQVVSDIRDICLRSFKALECEGLARVDGFATPDGQIFVNEINTMPGFTSISMYPKMWEASGIGYSDLITRLIEFAMQRYERDAKLKTSRD